MSSPDLRTQWRAAIRGDAPCPACGRDRTRKGRPFRSLGAHAAQAHGMTALELRDAAGLRMTDATCSPELSAHLASAASGRRPPRRRAGDARAAPRIPRVSRDAWAAGAVERGPAVLAAFTPEQRRDYGHRGGRARMASLDADQRRELGRAGHEAMLEREIARRLP